MATIIGISGSLRTHSINAALLPAAVQLIPSGSPRDLATIKGMLEGNTGRSPPSAAIKRMPAGSGQSPHGKSGR